MLISVYHGSMSFSITLNLALKKKRWSLTLLQAYSLSSKGNGDQDVRVGDPLLLLEGSLGEAEDLGEGILTSRKTSLEC